MCFQTLPKLSIAGDLQQVFVENKKPVISVKVQVFLVETNHTSLQLNLTWL